MHQLKGGHHTADKRLDRVPQFDDRSKRFRLAAPPDAALHSRVWRLERSRMGDQGNEGACVEFGITHELAAAPVQVSRARLTAIRSGHAIYWPAQREDEWPGGSYPGAQPVYEGTSVLAGLKVTTGLGYYDGYRWGFTDDERVAGVVHEGPGVCGTWWPEGAAHPRPSGLITTDGSDLGGHCVAWIGVMFGHKLKGERRMDIAVIAQSWGLDHGDGGRVYCELSSWLALLQREAEVAFPIGRRQPVG